MANTVVGVFDDYSQAQKAVDELITNGFPKSIIQLSPAADSPDARRALLRETEQADDPSQQSWSIGSFISMLFGNDNKDEHIDLYSEAIRRGSYLLSVDADTAQEGLKAIDILNRYDPVDIDERASLWRRDGWSKHDRAASPLDDHEIERERSIYASARPQSTPEQNQARNRVRMFERSSPATAQAGNSVPGSSGTADEGAGFSGRNQPNDYPAKGNDARDIR